MTTINIILFTTLIAVTGLYLIYANLIRLKNTANQALSSITVQLRKRYDLIPQVLTLAKKYMQHERALLEEITNLRVKATNVVSIKNQAEASELFDTDAKLNSKMNDFKVAMEAYPELKSDNTIKEAILAYRDVEDNISAARRFYNSAVSELNSAVETFPGSLIAPISNATVMPFYQDAEPSKIQSTIDVENYL